MKQVANNLFKAHNFCFTIVIINFVANIYCWNAAESVASAYTSPNFEQIELNFSVREDVPIGTLIGVIKSNNSSVNVQPPYLIVPLPGGNHKINSSNGTLSSSAGGGGGSGGGGVDTDLNIDESSGEIRTAMQLDREQRSYYSFITIPLTGANVKVTIIIEDINDNPPKFPTNQITLEFPENSKPRDVKRTLPPARDLDLGSFGTEKYEIVSGNIGDAFRLLSHREKDDVLYLDLQVSGTLDREKISSYTLVIEALDGGRPPLKDEMTVKITILDHNDCEPVFTQNHYYGSVAENVSVGTALLKVTAIDNDYGDNGLITYSIHSKNSPVSSLSPYFGINKDTGWIYVSKPLDFESKEIHELVVIAKDSGAQPLETPAFVSIRVTDVNDNQPAINLLFLTENARPEIPENAKIGDLVARISVSDADFSELPNAKRESDNTSMDGLSVNISGGDGNFGLTTQDTIIYLIVVTGPLDRRLKSKYLLSVVVTDQGNPPLNATHSFELEVTESKEKLIATRPAIEVFTDSSTASLMNSTAKRTFDFDMYATSSVMSNNTSIPSWILFLIVLLMLITVILLISIIVINRLHQSQQQQIMSGQVRHITTQNIGSLLRKIGPLGSTEANLSTYHSHHTSHYAPPAPPCYNDVTIPNSSVLGILNGEGHSASSGRGSAEDEDEVDADDLDDADEEIRMITEGANYYRDDDDPAEHITTTAEYLARLGVINHHEDEHEESSITFEDEEDEIVLDQLGNINSPRIDSAASVCSVNSQRFSSVRAQQKDRIAVQTQPTRPNEWPAMCGSLSSIIHSEEELSGSYNWDYLQHWGPKYQPLSAVFAEIARLKASNDQHDDSEDMVTIEAQIAAENGSTRSSSTVSSSHHHIHGHHLRQSSRLSATHSPSALNTLRHSPAFHPSLSPLTAEPDNDSDSADQTNNLAEEVEIEI